MDPTYPLFPIFAFLGFIISLVPLPWHLQAWNSGTCAFMLWTAVLCLVEFVNAIVWKGNMNDVAPVWCDISTQIMLGAGIGMPASVLCISRRLYKITSISTVSVTRADKRKNIMIDLGIAVGIPAFVLVLHTIVHAHRYDIVEDIGCYPVTFSTLLSFFLYYAWPIVLGLVSFIYSTLTLRSFFIRRAQFTTLLSSNAVNMNRYIRLMLLSVCDMSLTVPLSIYVMYIGTAGIPLSPWISWEDTHYHWNRVEIVPAVLWRASKEYEISVELTRWLAVFCAFIFFGLFGFASEAKKNYHKMFWAIAKRLGFEPKAKSRTPPKFTLPSWGKAKSNTATDSQATLPVYAISHSPPARKGSSFCSPGGESMELGLYSPTLEKHDFPSSPPRYSPSTSRFSFDTHPSINVEVDSSRPSIAGSDVDISEARTASICGFEDDFKPLPPLPVGDARRFTARPPSPPPTPALRHAVSMPLPISRDRQGSITVVVETRVDDR